jgi:P-type Mg2+ transporter
MRGAAAPESHEAWWQQAPEAALAALGTTAQGLSTDEGAERLARWGANRLAAPQGWELLGQIARRLRDPLVLVLLVAGVLSLVSGEPASAGIIAAVILVSIVLDQVQQRQAESAARRLRDSVAVRTRVLG